MRLFVGMLAALGAAAMPLALADPSATTPATEAVPATAPATAAPAEPAKPATRAAPAQPATPQVDPFEKHLTAEGYRPEMRNGEKFYCRTENPLGTRVGGVKNCGTVEQLKQQESNAREGVSSAQRASGWKPPGN